ncbi:MAG: type II CAAX endopeptidase family protein [Ilumatobacteraceae bacterium]
MRVDLTRTGIRDAGRPVDVPVAIVTWFGGWLVGMLVAGVLYGASGAEDVDDVGIPILFAGVAAGWAAYLVGMWFASRRSGTGDFVEDYHVRFRTVDLVGLPIGVLSQLVLVPLVYVPLTRLWPDTFTDDRLSENAEKLADRASGATMLLLVLMVCVGAPIVEELVYRGLLQGSFAARFNHVAAWLVAAAWFAVIHFRPVEYPGLFAFGLVVGACFLVTRRLGMSMATHVAFNVTGLLLAVR